MMDKYMYILVGQTPVLAESEDQFHEFYRNIDNRRVAWTEVNGVQVSTVFLGFNHAFTDDRPPVLFETMIFGEVDGEDEKQWRWCTWKEAEDGHNQIVADLRKRRILTD